MTDPETAKQQARERQRRRRERKRAFGLVEVTVTVLADRVDDLRAFAAKLRGD